MRILVFITCILIIYWLIEALRHSWFLRKAPKRILVTGTRGKSSICRLIAAGLNAGGIRTMAKTTGSATKIIAPDGSEQDISRNGSTTILEQCKIIKIAARSHVEALVLESMALRPQLQWAEAQCIIKPQILVITNVGPDHLDVSGETLPEIAKAFARAIPYRGDLFTREVQYLAILEKKAWYMDCNVHSVNIKDCTPESNYGEWSYIEHPENIELALAVCKHFNVDREIALAGMRKATPDIGALREIAISVNNGTVTFINAFAANDPESTENIFNRFQDKIFNNRVILLINIRNDRPHRSLQMVELVKKYKADQYILCGGDSRTIIKARLQSVGIAAESLFEFRKSEQVIIHLENSLTPGAVIIGIGNITGAGKKIINYFMNKQNSVTNETTVY